MPDERRVGGAAGSTEDRRHLTVVFCDLVGSSALAERLDPEDLQRVVREYHDAVTAIVDRLGGFVARYQGDGLLLYFGYPAAHEDDARRAVLASLEVVENPSFNRHLYLPLDVNVFCADWHTRSGHLVLNVVPWPPAIEGGNILEDIITIRDNIDAGVRSAFSPPLPIPITGPACNTIGVGELDVFWDKPTRPIVRPALDAVRFRPTIVVTFDRLKRLRARNIRGGIVYRESENIILNAFANYSQAQKVATMREGDEIALNLPPHRARRAGTREARHHRQRGAGVEQPEGQRLLRRHQGAGLRSRNADPVDPEDVLDTAESAEPEADVRERARIRAHLHGPGEPGDSGARFADLRSTARHPRSSR